MGKKLCALNKTVLFGSWSNFIGKLVLFFATRRRSSYVCYSNGLDYVSGLWNPLESRTAEMFVCDKLQCHFEIRTRGARKTISGSTYQNKPGFLAIFIIFIAAIVESISLEISRLKYISKIALQYLSGPIAGEVQNGKAIKNNIWNRRR